MASTAATATAAPPAMPSTDEAWKVAQKLRAAIAKELEHVQKGGRGANELARFEKVEKLMENYRLACLQTIWPDMRAANEKNAEDALWHTHTLVTKAYRKVLGRLQGDDNVVLRRKVEKLYAHYLKTAQYFYRGYLQRVCARYDMKDLKRIARRADLEEMPLPDKEKVDASATQLEDIVKRSCHKTLIYLGDLARYRTLLRAKDPKWDNALAYYLLANELIPESGHGYHQCGVIYVEIGDHLQVVYHLYRALACDMPHPNASTNLDLEFRELQKRKDITTKHALVTWFVKLHAFYSQGKEFTERKELEKEVDHRLDLAMKSGKGYDSDVDLLKIVLINITAYVAAQDKVAKNWTDEGSRSCQFLLLLNLRTINAIARLIGDEITDVIKRKDAEAPVGNSAKAPQSEPQTKFTPAFNRVLPLLRVYMAWLCSYGSQLVEFRPHLEPQFGTMCITLSNTLSLLFELLGGDQQLGNPVSWRFPEDDITIGIRCLNGPDLHDGCQLYYDAFTRKPKPRREDVPDANNNTDDDVTFTRALDILLCGLDLSEPESKFPFTTSTVTKGGRELTAFVYLEGGKPDPIPNPLPVQQMASTAIPASTERNLAAPVMAPSPCESNELSENRDFYGPNLRSDTGTNLRKGPAPASMASAPKAPVSEFPIERQMFNILNEFINPPESTPATKPETPNRLVAGTTQYGMASASAAETFGARAPASSGPGSAGAKVLPTLPWEYFYKPSANPPLHSSGTNGLAAGWAANGRAFSPPASPRNGLQLGTGTAVGSPLARQAQPRYDSRKQSRLLEEQEDILRSLDLDSTEAGQQQSHGAQGDWPAVAAQSSNSVFGTTSHSLQQQSAWAPPAGPWKTTHGQNTMTTTTAGAIPNSPFSTLNFSTGGSSLPPVSSPWGMPSHNASARNWPDARQPRTSISQQSLGLDIWGNAMGQQQQQLAVGESSGGTWAVQQQQGMPKR